MDENEVKEMTSNEMKYVKWKVGKDRLASHSTYGSGGLNLEPCFKCLCYPWVDLRIHLTIIKTYYCLGRKLRDHSLVNMPLT